MNSNLSDENNQEDIEGIKRRLTSLEEGIESRRKNWKKIIVVVSVIFILLFTIGVIQFVSSY